jgi:glycosyltransferase involved in cell wall biosynthesis
MERTKSFCRDRLPENRRVSIIVTTRNSASTLSMCLKSIFVQTYQNIEVIVVDNYSNDSTRAIAEAYGAKILLQGPERSVQRNIGAKNACGESLFFVDSDMELTPSVVEECVKILSKGYDAIIVPEVTVGRGFWAKVRALERSAYVGDMLFECSRFFKKDVFERLHGYDETLTGSEDFDLQSNVEEAGYRIGRTASPILHHEETLRISSHLRKKLYYSRSFKRYEQKHPEKAKRQLGLRRISTYWKVLAKNPVQGFFVLFLKGTEYMISKIVKFFS